MMLKELFEKRLLRKIPKDLDKSKKSLEISKKYLNDCKNLINMSAFNLVILSAYTSMFHAARALLYRDGIQEKSHFAVYIYINEKYSGKIPKNLIEAFKSYQLERHEVLYGFNGKIEREDAESAIEDAEEFLIKIKEILKNGII